MRRFIRLMLSLTLAFSVSIFHYNSLWALGNGFEEEVFSAFVKMGISEEKAAELVNKIECGKTLDCFSKEYSNIAPVAEEWNDEGYTATFEYPDGSRAQVSINSSIIEGTITGGNYSSGSKWYVWNGAKVMATWGVVTASYYANFEGSTGFGYISSVYDRGISVLAGSYSNVSLSIVQSYATSTSPAQARLFFEYSSIGNAVNSTLYLRLFVPYNGSPYARLSIG